MLKIPKLVIVLIFFHMVKANCINSITFSPSKPKLLLTKPLRKENHLFLPEILRMTETLLLFLEVEGEAINQLCNLANHSYLHLTVGKLTMFPNWLGAARRWRLNSELCKLCGRRD